MERINADLTTGRDDLAQLLGEAQGKDAQEPERHPLAMVGHAGGGRQDGTELVGVRPRRDHVARLA